MNSTSNLGRGMSFSIAITIMLLSIFSGVWAGAGYGAELEDWIEISNEAGLAAINNNLSANYKLLSDINLSSNWTPLGTFTGNFDGNGKVVRNITISNTTIGNAGLFTIIGTGAQVRNFGIEGANITAGNNAGILAGTNNGAISKVYVNGSVSGQDNVGGLVGYNTATINNSFAAASVSGKDKLGGLVGLNSGTINQSYSTSQVIDSVFNNYLVFDGTTGYISIPHHADYVTGTFTLEAWFQWDDVTKPLDTDPNNYVDFIIGKGVERFEIHTEGGSGRNGVRFIPIGNVGGDTHLDVKNVLQPGWFHVAASYSYSEDNDQATASFFVNGVAQDIWQQGVNVGKVATMLRTSAPAISTSEINIGRRTDGSYSFKGRIADVRFWNTVRTEEQIAANKDRKLTGTEPGLVGYWKLNEDMGVTAVDSVQVNGNPKNNGTLVGGITRTSQSAATNKGGLVGSNSGTVSSSYYDSTVSLQADVGKGAGKITDEMKTQETFSGWDFINTWGINGSINGGYPYLKLETTYTVTFKDHDNTVLKTEVVNSGGGATAPSDQTRTGYTFIGWSPAYNNITGNLTVTAQYSINQFTVTFKDHDDTTLKTETVNYGGNATPPSNPARAGYTFTGWSTEYNNVTSNLIIIAQYTANSGIAFKVEHYRQRLNMTGYDLYETDNLTGSTGQSVIASPKSYTGFTENNSYPASVVSGTVSADGSLTLKIYYDIASYTINSIEDQILEAKTEGYSSDSQEIKTITINKTGTSDLTNLAVAISGSESSNFAITQPQDTVLDDTTTSTTFTLKVKTGLTAGTYTETVMVSGDNMTNVTFTITQVINALSAPVIQTMVSGDEHVNISWSNVADATGYKLYKSTTSGSYGSDFLSVSNSVYDVKGLSNGTTYYFILKAVNGGCESVNSNEMSVTPQVDAPGAPALKSAFAGDGHVILVWDGVLGSNGYKVYSSTASGSYSSHVASVAESVYNYDVTGLNNGTTYYFALKATNPGGTSPYSNEISAKPQVAKPIEPTGVSAASGNAKVSLKWNSVEGATSYKVYQTTTSGSYGSEVSSVSGSAYNYDVTGLTNGTIYYFVVKATNSGGESPNSIEVSAVPKTVPGVPVNVTAEAGNGQATITFLSPAQNGGSLITGYIVTSYPDNITATGNGTTITVTGLKNGTTYTFKVRAVNEVGNGDESQASNEVKLYKPSSGDSSTKTTTTTTNTETTKTAEPEKPVVTGLEVIVNGKTEILATATTTKAEDKTITTIVVDDKKIEEKLDKEGNNSIITIPVKNNSDIVVGTLNGQTIKNMEIKEAVLEVKTENVTYTLPASQINIDTVSQQIGKYVELKDIAVNVKISGPTEDTAKIVENTANKNNYHVVVKPIDFEITCTSGNKTVDISKFNSYVERMVAIPEGVNPTKITTGVVLNNDGTFSHVPTTIEVIEGKYYAKINSLTNSTYSVIWSPKIFKDVEEHWSKDAANDMGSRLIVDGIGDGRFEPDQDITRAEFAAIVIRALGLLRAGTGKNVFNDVAKDTWYYDSVYIAYEYEIISGYGDGKFGPMDKTTREQAMVMIARAMKLSNLRVELKDDEEDAVISLFTDLEKSSDWAKDSIAVCIKSEIMLGRGGTMIVPKDNITRAEAAMIVKRLLTKSNLI